MPLGKLITEEIITSSIHVVFAAGTCAADLSTTWWPAELDRINTVTFVTSATYSSQCTPMTATVYINHAWWKLYPAPQCKMFSFTDSNWSSDRKKCDWQQWYQTSNCVNVSTALKRNKLGREREREREEGEKKNKKKGVTGISDSKVIICIGNSGSNPELAPFR